MILKAIREGLGRVVVFVDYLLRPKQVQRSETAQRDVEAAAAKLALYQFYACPFCIKTRRSMHRLRLPIELRDAQNDPLHRAALLNGGGVVQVPCLRIEEKGASRWLYESNKIIDYLEERFSPRDTAADAIKQAS